MTHKCTTCGQQLPQHIINEREKEIELLRKHRRFKDVTYRSGQLNTLRDFIDVMTEEDKEFCFSAMLEDREKTFFDNETFEMITWLTQRYVINGFKRKD